ncbi:IS630 family transposase, partial [Sphingobium cupriresistens]
RPAARACAHGTVQQPAALAKAARPPASKGKARSPSRLITDTNPPAKLGNFRCPLLRNLRCPLTGAICPAEGKAACIVMPRCNSETMSMHLEEIAFHVAPGAHAVLLLDQAGWHGSVKLVVPPNITLMPLPPRCPELNPVENVWQFMRDNWLSNRVFQSNDDIVDHCCFAWNKLVEQP